MSSGAFPACIIFCTHRGFFARITVSKDWCLASIREKSGICLSARTIKRIIQAIQDLLPTYLSSNSMDPSFQGKIEDRLVISGVDAYIISVWKKPDKTLLIMQKQSGPVIICDNKNDITSFLKLLKLAAYKLERIENELSYYYE